MRSSFGILVKQSKDVLSKDERPYKDGEFDWDFNINLISGRFHIYGNYDFEQFGKF